MASETVSKSEILAADSDVLESRLQLALEARETV